VNQQMRRLVVECRLEILEPAHSPTADGVPGIAHRLIDQFNVVAAFRKNDHGDRRFLH
jgi:hypothetical protein